MNAHRIGPDCWAPLASELELFDRAGDQVTVYQATVSCVASPGQELPALVFITQAEYNRLMALDGAA